MNISSWLRIESELIYLQCRCYSIKLNKNNTLHAFSINQSKLVIISSRSQDKVFILKQTNNTWAQLFRHRHHRADFKWHFNFGCEQLFDYVRIYSLAVVACVIIKILQKLLLSVNFPFFFELKCHLNDESIQNKLASWPTPNSLSHHSFELSNDININRFLILLCASVWVFVYVQSTQDLWT